MDSELGEIWWEKRLRLPSSGTVRVVPLNLILGLTEALLVMHSVQNFSCSLSLLLPFSLKTYHFSLEVVKFYTWTQGRNQIGPGITDLIRNVTATANSHIAVWNNTNFCEHGVDLVVTLSIVLSILRIHLCNWHYCLEKLRSWEKKWFFKFLIFINEHTSGLCFKSLRKFQ